MKLRTALLVGLAVFLYTLLTHAPAATLYGWLVPRTPPPMVEARGLDGTLAQGRIAGLAVANRTVAQQLEWQLLPWRLLLLTPSFALESKDPATVLKMRVGWGLTGAVTFSDVQAVVSLKDLLKAATPENNPFMAMVLAGADGQARLQLARLRMQGGKLVAAEGQIDVQGLAWMISKAPLVFGDFHATVETGATEIVLKLASSETSALEATGDGKLGADGSYALNLQYRSRPTASPQLRGLLSTSGTPPDTRGYYHFRTQGKLADRPA